MIGIPDWMAAEDVNIMLFRRSEVTSTVDNMEVLRR